MKFGQCGPCDPGARCAVARGRVVRPRIHTRAFHPSASRCERGLCAAPWKLSRIAPTFSPGTSFLRAPPAGFAKTFGGAGSGECEPSICGLGRRGDNGELAMSAPAPRAAALSIPLVAQPFETLRRARMRVLVSSCLRTRTSACSLTRRSRSSSAEFILAPACGTLIPPLDSNKIFGSFRRFCSE